MMSLSVGRIALSVTFAVILFASPGGAVSMIESSSSGAKGSEGVKTSTVPLGAAGQLMAFSESPPQTNGSVTFTQNGVPAAVPFAGPVTIGWFFQYTYDPVQKTGFLAKPPGSIFNLKSSSAGFNRFFGATDSFAEANIAVPRAPGGGGPTATLTVNSDVNISKDAFARASDPVMLAAGQVDVEVDISVDSLFANGPLSYAGLGYTFGTNLPGFEEIFRLQLQVDGTGGEPFVGYLANSDANLPSEDQIHQFFDDHFVKSDGKWRLDEPLQLLFSLSSAQSFEISFEDFAYAHAAPVPEPGTAGLLTVGFALLAARRVIRRGGRKGHRGRSRMQRQLGSPPACP